MLTLRQVFKGTPYAVTHDGRTLRYPDPDVKPNDTIRLDIASGKVLDHVKFEAGSTVTWPALNTLFLLHTVSYICVGI